MRILIAIAAILLTMPGAFAQGRPDSLAMSCAQVQSIVRARGAAVIGSGPNIYDRFVASRRFCEPTQELEPAWVPSRDTGQCFVGYRCREFDYDDFFD